MKQLLYILLLTFLMTSCGNEEAPGTDYGTLRISTLKQETGKTQTITPRADQGIPDDEKGNFRADICHSNGDVFRTYTDISELEGQSIPIPAGDYFIQLYSENYNTDIPNENTGNASYFGSSPFNIIKGGTTVINQVTARQSNTGVSVTYSDEIKTYFPTATTTVTDGTRSYTFSSDSNPATAYFAKTASLTYTLKLTNTDNEEFSNTVVFDIADATNYTIEVSLNAANRFRSITTKLKKQR